MVNDDSVVDLKSFIYPKKWQDYVIDNNKDTKKYKPVIDLIPCKIRMKNKSVSTLLPDYRGLEWISLSKEKMLHLLREYRLDYLQKINSSTSLYLQNNNHTIFKYVLDTRIRFLNPIEKIETYFSLLIKSINKTDNCDWGLFKTLTLKLFGMKTDWISNCKLCKMGMVRSKYKGKDQKECLQFLNQYISRDLTMDKDNFKIEMYSCKCIKRRREKFCSKHCAKLYWNKGFAQKRHSCYL